MSSKHRRIKRKIERIVRLDAQARRYRQGWQMDKRAHLYYAIIMPLCRKITAMGYGDRGMAAMGVARGEEA